MQRNLIKEYAKTITWLVKCLDIAVILLSGMIAYYCKFKHLSIESHYQIALLTAAIISFFIFSIFHIYQSIRGKNFWRHAWDLMQALLVVMVLMSSIAFTSKTGEKYSREWFLYWFLLSFTNLIIFRAFLFCTLHFFRRHGLNQRYVMIVGDIHFSKRLITEINQSLWTGFKIKIILTDELENNTSFIEDIPVQRRTATLSEVLSLYQIDEVWIALPLHAEARVKQILHELRYHTVATRFFLDIFGLDLLNHSVSDIAGFPVLNIKSTPMVGFNRLFKAIEDRLCAFFILLLISPLMVCIAILVKSSSPGPIFYRQKRVSWNGKAFNMLKFRSMPVDAEKKSGPVWATANEERATKIGVFLRKTSLDELPQFLNVLKGDMSIVGPRPERPEFVEQFKEDIPGYMQKHLMKAGITGWAQVNGWRGNTSLEKRIEYDLYYIENWSLLFDIKIIALTLLKGFINKNAY